MKDIRKVWANNRLTVIGPKKQVQLFQSSKWDRRLGARFCELMDRSKARYISDFKTEAPPIERLRKLSLRWPGLTLFLDYEMETERIKGLVKARVGELEHCRMCY